MTLVRLLNYHLQSSGLKKEHQIRRQIRRVSEFESHPPALLMLHFRRSVWKNLTGGLPTTLHSVTFTFLRGNYYLFTCVMTRSL